MHPDLEQCLAYRESVSSCGYFVELITKRFKVDKYTLLLMLGHVCHVRLYDLIDCSPSGSSVHRIFQARILEWVAMPSSRGSSQLSDGTHISCVFCIAGGFFTTEPPEKPQIHLVAQSVENLPTVQEPQVPSLGQEDPLEKEMATHSSILAWRNPIDGGAWWATVHGVSKSQTQLRD